MSKPTPLSQQEFIAKRKWWEEWVLPHFDNGGRADRRNIVGMVELITRFFETCDDLQQDITNARARAATAERALADAKLRTPGPVEVCKNRLHYLCGHYAREDRECLAQPGQCPLRPQDASRE